MTVSGLIELVFGIPAALAVLAVLVRGAFRTAELKELREANTALRADRDDKERRIANLETVVASQTQQIKALENTITAADAIAALTSLVERHHAESQRAWDQTHRELRGLREARTA